MDYHKAVPLLISCSHVPCSLQNILGKFHTEYSEVHTEISQSAVTKTLVYESPYKENSDVTSFFSTSLCTSFMSQ